MMYLGSDPVGITREGLANDISIIDDTAGAGDKTKVWSADRTNELQTELDMLIEKRVVPPPAPVEITQVCDLSNATKKQWESSQIYYFQNVKIDFYWNGYYYPNPSNVNLSFGGLKAYNSNGEEVQIYRNGGSADSITTFSDGKYLQKVDSRTFKVYQANGTLDWTYTADDDVAYLNHSHCYVQTNTDPDQMGGMTFGGSSTTYIPYGESDESEYETEYEYEYSDELGDFAQEYISENYTDEKPTENSDNYVKSGGIVSYLLKDTYNLIEPEWFDWENASAYVSLKPGLYVPVVAGKYLLCNCNKVVYTFYSSDKTQLSTGGTAIPYAEVEAPENSAYMRIQLNNGAGYIPADHKVVIYYSRLEDSPRDDIRPYVEHKNLIGMRGSDEIFDHYAPTSLDKQILQMAKYAAVRSMNFCNNILRIGTFNMYNPRTTHGWESTKKMLQDYAMDIVGFQEVSESNDRVLTEYLKGWQFTDGRVSAPVAIASHFAVISYDSYTTTVTDRVFMRCKIQLPRYGDIIDPVLSVYTYHGTSTSKDLRLQEIQEILDVIELDDSDFIVIVGDTNSFDDDHPEWEAWSDAGFTPAHNGDGMTTVIEDGFCIDNIFFSQNISCKNVHVVPARDYMISINGGEPVPLSDHDFVFADLQFDFHALLDSISES